MKTPCFLKLFVASDCPFCPRMVHDLAPFPMENDLVTLTIIDGLLFPEMAEPYDIKSAPTLLLDDRLRWTGQTPLDEILDVMLNQDPSLLSPASMEALLGDGRADLVAKMMMGEGTLFPAFLDMLVHEKWPVRLGAMVAMEDIIERDKGLAAQCVEPLWERFSDLNHQVRGDVIYILGEAGTGEMIPRLEAVLGEATDAETRESATEAIETILKRM
ncbi:MAG: thioredoxin family protein [Deltaproteobacteria bacterium]|nr:thioredoxin family protein [Deltaproteobacteria bacterium]